MSNEANIWRNNADRINREKSAEIENEKNLKNS